MKDLVIVGGGGFGRQVAWIVEDINRFHLKWNILGFLDDKLPIGSLISKKYRVLGGLEWLLSKSISVAVGIGNSETRSQLITNFRSRALHFPTLIHPTVVFPDSVEIGEGTIVSPGTIISVDVKIGRFVIINMNSTIGHDVTLNDFVTLNPGVSLGGYSIIEQGVTLGINSTVLQQLSIGKQSYIGGGAVVIKNIPDYSTAVGVPAKVIKQYDK